MVSLVSRHGTITEQLRNVWNENCVFSFDERSFRTNVPSLHINRRESVNVEEKMQAQLHTILEEWRGVGVSQPFLLDMAELCSNGRHSLSTFTVTMPMHISPSDMACAPTRFNKKKKAGSIPSGPSLSENQLIYPGTEQELPDLGTLFTTSDEFQTK